MLCSSLVGFVSLDARQLFMLDGECCKSVDGWWMWIMICSYVYESPCEMDWYRADSRIIRRAGGRDEGYTPISCNGDIYMYGRS